MEIYVYCLCFGMQCIFLLFSEFTLLFNTLLHCNLMVWSVSCKRKKERESWNSFTPRNGTPMQIVMRKTGIFGFLELTVVCISNLLQARNMFHENWFYSSFHVFSAKTSLKWRTKFIQRPLIIRILVGWRLIGTAPAPCFWPPPYPCPTSDCYISSTETEWTGLFIWLFLPSVSWRKQLKIVETVSE